MRFLILFIFLTTNVFANDVSEIKNIVIHKELKVYDNVIFLDKNDKKINIKEFNGNLLLLNFWATWCAPCKAIAPVLEDLAAEYDGKAKVVKVDVTENQEIAARYGIRNIPALYLFKDGEVVDQVVGALPRSQLVNFVEKNL